MTTQFDRPLYGFRFAEIRRGDSLQTIAARELGTAARWFDLIAYNDLVPPYVTDDPAQVKPGVLLSGKMILVPAPAPVVSTTTDPEQVFQTDIKLDGNGNLTTERGDLVVVAGRDNLKQALTNRVVTERGELIFHMEYGSYIRRILGAVNGPTAGLLSAQYARAAVLADPRINQVNEATAEVTGDVVRVSIEAEPVTGRPVQIDATT